MVSHLKEMMGKAHGVGGLFSDLGIFEILD
jgi:hypothetical protein